MVTGNDDLLIIRLRALLRRDLILFLLLRVCAAGGFLLFFLCVNTVAEMAEFVAAQNSVLVGLLASILIRRGRELSILVSNLSGNVHQLLMRSLCTAFGIGAVVVLTTFALQAAFLPIQGFEWGVCIGFAHALTTIIGAYYRYSDKVTQAILLDGSLAPLVSLAIYGLAKSFGVALSAPVALVVGYGVVLLASFVSLVVVLRSEKNHWHREATQAGSSVVDLTRIGISLVEVIRQWGIPAFAVLTLEKELSVEFSLAWRVVLAAQFVQAAFNFRYLHSVNRLYLNGELERSAALIQRGARAASISAFGYLTTVLAILVYKFGADRPLVLIVSILSVGMMANVASGSSGMLFKVAQKETLSLYITISSAVAIFFNLSLSLGLVLTTVTICCVWIAENLVAASWARKITGINPYIF